MADLVLPELWFTRTYIPTGNVFKERFTNANCAGWGKTALEDLHIRAAHRIATLNMKMPGQWAYELTGWEINKEDDDNG